VLGKANIKNLLLIPIKFSIGRISFYPKWLYWGIAGIWTGFIFFTIKTVFIKTVFYLLIFPLILGFLVSFFAPMLQYFRFIYLIPLMSLLLSRSNLRGWILAIGFLIFSLIYLLNPVFHREDWKNLVKSLPEDKPVYMIVSSSDPVKYYNNKLIIIPLRSDFIGTTEGQEEIIVIPYAAEIYGLNYKSLLSKNGYQKKKEVSFREITYEQWTK
jgi:signal transduction histidine kinase